MKIELFFVDHNLNEDGSVSFRYEKLKESATYRDRKAADQWKVSLP
jgi:hypothetical protein